MGRWDTFEREASPASASDRSSSTPSKLSSNHNDMHWEQFEDIEDDLLRMCENLRQRLSKHNPGFGDRIQLSNFCEYIANHSTLLNISRT